MIDLARVGAEWTATCAQLPGFRVWRDDLDAVKQAARDELGPAVRFRDVEPPALS